MAGAAQGLILKFGTDLLPAQKSIQDFALNAVSHLSSLGKMAAESQKGLETLGTAAAGLRTAVVAFAAFEAFKFSLEAVGKAADEAAKELTRLVKIADDAQGAGVNSTFFQQFTEGSKKMGLEAADLTSILTSLRDASTVNIGTGDEEDPKSEAQKAIDAEVRAGNLGSGANAEFASQDSQEDRLRTALSFLVELQDKGAKLAELDLAGKLFGSDFETKLRNDDDLVNKLQQRIIDMASGKGANVIPQEQLDTARELDAEMEDLNNRVINALTPFHNDLRGWQQDELRATLELKGYWVDMVEVFGDVYAKVDSIGKRISSWGNASFFHSLTQSLDSMGLIDHTLVTPVPKSPYGELDRRPFPTISRPKGDTSKPLPDDKEKHEHEDKDPIETYINELKKAAAAEEAEAKTVGLGVKAKQEAVDLAKAMAIATENDRTLTAAETAAVKEQADAYANAKIKIDQFNKSQEQAKEAASFFGNQFESSIEKIVLSGGKLADVFKSFATALEQAALKALILGEGPLAGLLGTAPAAGATGAASVGGLVGLISGGAGGLFSGAKSLFSGLFADGGSIPNGQWGIAGEAGPEIIHGPANVVPMAALRSGGGGPSITHAPNYSIDARGAQLGVADQIQGALQAYDKQSRRTIGAAMDDWNKRYRT